MQKLVCNKEDVLQEIFDGTVSTLTLFDEQTLFLKLSLTHKEAPLIVRFAFKNHDNEDIDPAADLYWSFTAKEPSRLDCEG